MLLIPYALALPSVDQPVVTNVKNTTDAAVVVGIGDYLRVDDVPYADADARAFAAFAQQTLGIPASRVWRPSNRNKENIEKAVEEAGKKVGRGGTVWVYFAGHGAADPTTKERLLLGDDVPNDGSYASRGVSISNVEKLAGAGGAKVIVVSDVCYTGQFRSLVLDPPKPAGAVLEWSATQKGEVAAPLAGTEHGAFTYLLLGAMRGWADGEPAVEGAAREPADGVVTAREARDFVERQLAALQMRSQVPVMEAGDGRYELTLVKGVREAAPVLSAPSASTGAGFGDLSLDVSAKVRQQECDQEALRLGAAARSARLDDEAKKAAAEASAAWGGLSAQAKACETLDATSRADCAATVDAFIARAQVLTVTLSAGEEPVTTKCGSARPMFAAESRAVAVAELGDAKAQAGRLSKQRAGAPLKSPATGLGGATKKVDGAADRVRLTGFVTGGAPLLNAGLGARWPSGVVLDFSASLSGLAVMVYPSSVLQWMFATCGPHLGIPVNSRWSLDTGLDVGLILEYGAEYGVSLGFVYAAPTGFRVNAAAEGFYTSGMFGVSPGINAGWQW